MSTFTANLAAFLTVSRMGTTIASLDELAAQSDVRWGVVIPVFSRDEDECSRACSKWSWPAVVEILYPRNRKKKKKKKRKEKISVL